MKVVFLGTGSAIPIPRGHDGRSGYRGTFRPAQAQRAIHDCAQCRSRDVRDRRVSSAIVIDDQVLIDAGPPIGELLGSVNVPPGNITAIYACVSGGDLTNGIGRQTDRRTAPRGDLTRGVIGLTVLEGNPRPPGAAPEATNKCSTDAGRPPASAIVMTYFRAGRNEHSTFDLFVRNPPAVRSFLVSAGLHTVVTYLERLRFCAAPGKSPFLGKSRSGD
jgi:hypothetical protein